MLRKKISFIVVILLIVLIGLLQIDDNLKPETKAWIEKTQKAVNTNNDAYLYFLGLMAPVNKDPIEVGRAIHKKVKAQPVPETTGQAQVESEYDSVYQIDDGLKIQPENICRVFNASCFTKLIDNKIQAEEIISKNTTLLKRYQQFLDMPDYQLMHPIGNWRSMPYYQHLVEANNISLISLLKLQDEELVNQRYSSLLEKTRLKLAQSGSLIEKMIYVALVNHNLEFYNLLYTSGIIENPINFNKLTQSEKSFQNVMGYEALSGLAMSNNFEFPWYALMDKALIKKNMMLNYRYDFVNKYNQLSLLPPHQQLEAVKTKKYKPEEAGFLNKYRNYSGWILNKVADAAYNDYIFRVSDVDAKIAVLNWRLQQPYNADIDKEYLEQHDTAKLNPYKTGSFVIKNNASYEESRNTKQKYVCVPTQYQDHKNVRCVQL